MRQLGHLRLGAIAPQQLLPVAEKESPQKKKRVGQWKGGGEFLVEGILGLWLIKCVFVFLAGDAFFQL